MFSCSASCVTLMESPLPSVHTQLACMLTLLLKKVNAASQPSLWLGGLLMSNRMQLLNDTLWCGAGSTPPLADQLRRLQLQQDRSEARYHRDQVKAQRSVTAAAGIGKLIKSSSVWNVSNGSQQLYKMFDVEDSTILKLCKKLLRSLPHSWRECVALAIEQRAKSKPGNKKRRNLDLTSQLADSSQSAPLTKSQVQLAWGYILRQLKQVGEEHAHWHLLDTSQSGVTGHSGKVDFCVSAVQQKAWPQVVAMAELKKDLQTESQHTECIGQLTARSVNIFRSQPHRKHVMMIAGGLDRLEVLAFFRDESILRSGLQSWSFDEESRALRWLSKLVFSSLPAMGFVPELPPLINTTPQGLLLRQYTFW